MPKELMNAIYGSREKIRELETEIGSIVTKLADGLMRENTRKARRMVMLYSFASVILCWDTKINKVSPGGFEIDGITEKIPFILLVLTVYSVFQFGIYSFVDISQQRYLKMKLGRKINSIKKNFGKGSFPESTSAVLKEAQIVKNSNSIQFLVDYVSPTLLFLTAIYMFLDRYCLG